MNNDLIVGLVISMIVNVIMVAVNNYLIFAILTRFKEYMKGLKNENN